ncbi:MAG TPA: GNA1162 family protein, partial [Acidobacteriota bacterium]|nr:GNA1162 family protein [Acidobacteriota bacterium]
AGCVTPPPPKDYTAFRQSNPRSILVLPPVNESTDVGATYSVLTTTTAPLAELGYYVLPVGIVDQFLKENGLTVPGEMHQAPLNKLREVFGCDAVLYLTVKQYGSKYQVFASNTYVSLLGKLVDARTGTVIWEGNAEAVYSGQSGLLEALVTQVMNKLFDQAHQVAAMASYQLFLPSGQGLPKGPRHPEYGARDAK